MITPQTLKALAEAMGKEASVNASWEDWTGATGGLHCRVKGVTGGIKFQPHKDKAQAFEVLEWMLNKEDRVERLILDNEGWRVQVSNLSIFGIEWEDVVYSFCNDTLQEAIVLAAIALLESEK